MTSDVNLETCSQEPIHIPGSIQSYGCLLVCDAQADRIVRYSGNISDFFPNTSADPVGERLADFFDDEIAHTFRNALARCRSSRRPTLLYYVSLKGADGALDVSLYRHDKLCFLQFERPLPNDIDLLETLQNIVAEGRAVTDIDHLARLVPRLLAAPLGYDRVMMYRFAEDGSGKVIGETKAPRLESFLGQHFPASDIPQQARRLYLENTIRVISDSQGASVPIVPELDEAGTALDLSFSHLRSVSPIHLEYLRNMGVSASMSISIIVNGTLWGLIACHHNQPKHLSMRQRLAAEMFGEFLSLHLSTLTMSRRFNARTVARSKLDALIAQWTHQQTAEHYLREKLTSLREIIASDGVGLWMQGRWTAEGATLDQADVLALVKALSERGNPAVFSSDSIDPYLASDRPVRSAAGVLAIQLSQAAGEYLIYFRKEQVETLNWGGDPTKTYATGKFGERLTPRASFAIWKQEVRGRSIPWTDEDRHMAEAVQVGLREVLLRQNEVLDEERRKYDVRQQVLNEELNHRVKNILALISSLVSNKSNEEITLEEFISTLKGRIMALSFAHDQIVRSDGGGSLKQLIAAELSPYGPKRHAYLGPDIGLSARAYSVMALVIHELATNAAKYGPLSVPAGRLTVSVSLNRNGDAEIDWVESDGPLVSPPTREGFGAVILRRSVPFDLDGAAGIKYSPEGVEARFRLPAKFLSSSISAPTQPHQGNSTQDRSDRSLENLSILLLEDQLVIAMDAEQMLRDMGVSDLRTAANVREAQFFIGERRPDVAILDINLGSETSIPLAETLVSEGVPFVFATGYGDSSSIPNHFRKIPIVRKPYSKQALAALISRVL